MNGSTINAPPDGLGVLRAIASNKLNWAASLSELIDNAFDADATEVSISMDKGRFLVTDNGRGCPNPVEIVRLGGRHQHSSTLSGEFGVGAKDALLWIGGENSKLVITTDYKGNRHRLSMTWRDYAQSGWDLHSPAVQPVAEDEGTKILVTPTQKSPLSGKNWDGLLANLGYRYFAAIDKGRSIWVNRKGTVYTVEPWRPPTFEEKLVRTVEVNGMWVEIECGIVPAGTVNPKPGMTYVSRWRVVRPAGAYGCGDYNPGRICGVIRVDPRWPISTHKDGFLEGEKALHEAVYNACHDVLASGHERGRELTNITLQSQVSDFVNAALGTRRKAKRKPRENPTGSVAPTGAGGPHTRADRTQPGDTFDGDDEVQQSRRGRGAKPCQVAWEPMGNANAGRVSGRYITLNLHNDFVKHAFDNNDVRANSAVAIGLLSNEVLSNDGGQLRLRNLSGETFQEIFGKLLNRGLVLDGHDPR